ncbi:uncharacterized protein DDB_G0283697-like [Nymphalis io]|uniref:uncharacterized protein DDB_G0283697-like n=1 Tax=Inachis io TaxID=171585 RepID=UPI0021685DA6|nr:uncharacterized protein DDB_G0283697-like [Nymphalis io]
MQGLALDIISQKGAGKILQETVNNLDCANATKHKDITNQNKIDTDTHDNKEREDLELPLTPNGIIKSANLADFNIKTLHKTLKPTNVVENNQKYNQDIENIEYSPILKNIETENNKSDQDEQIGDKKNPYRKDYIENDTDKVIKTQHVKDSEENILYPDSDKYSDIPENTEKELSRRQQSKESEESIEKNLPKKSNVNYKRDEDEVVERKHDRDNERNAVNEEHYDKYRDIPQNTEEESIESKENDEQYSTRPTIDVHHKDEDLSTENEYNSRENKFSEERKSSADKELLPIETKSSEDSVEDKNQYSSDKDYVSDSPLKENLSSREDDLVDFSHESIEVNDQVRKAKDFNKHNHNEHIIANTQNKPSKSKEHLTPTDENKSNQLNDNFNDYEKQVKINDGEVKPVIELNNEDSDEESDENPKDTINANLRDNVEKKINSDISLEIENPKEDKINLKQQFERIPLDYNHALKKTNTSQNEQDGSDGTLDTLSPKNVDFDENLNIKFSDVTVKLPEIKLPDDILSYAKEEPAYDNNKEKDKKNYFYYDDSDEQTEEESDKANNDNDKKNNRDDFYKQRSEKLQELPPKQNNPKLFEKIQNVLKKANNIQKEAEKSGDPKAGYLWTLEYGENL